MRACVYDLPTMSSPFFEIVFVFLVICCGGVEHFRTLCSQFTYNVVRWAIFLIMSFHLFLQLVYHFLSFAHHVLTICLSESTQEEPVLQAGPAAELIVFWRPLAAGATQNKYFIIAGLLLFARWGYIEPRAWVGERRACETTCR